MFAKRMSLNALLVVVGTLLMAPQAFAAKFTLTASVGGALDASLNPIVPTPDISTNVGFAAFYGINYYVTTNFAELAADEVAPHSLTFGIDQTDGVTDSLGLGWLSNFPSGDIIAQNGDVVLPPNDLNGILVAFRPPLPFDPRNPTAPLFPTEPILIGQTILEWDGLGPATSSTFNVQFGARLTDGSLRPVSGASFTIHFGAVPEPSALVLGCLALVSVTMYRQR